MRKYLKTYMDRGHVGCQNQVARKRHRFSPALRSALDFLGLDVVGRFGLAPSFDAELVSHVPCNVMDFFNRGVGWFRDKVFACPSLKPPPQRGANFQCRHLFGELEPRQKKPRGPIRACERDIALGDHFGKALGSIGPDRLRSGCDFLVITHGALRGPWKRQDPSLKG